MNHRPFTKTLSLIILFAILLLVFWLWSSVDKPLPRESVWENLGKAWSALASDPTRAIREGRAPFLWIMITAILFAFAVKVVDWWYEPDISPFGTNRPFIAYTFLVFLAVMMLEAGASAYGWYNYFALNEPYRTLFTGNVTMGVTLDKPPPYWGGAPFDSFTHTLAGASTAAILLNFRITKWLGFDDGTTQSVLKWKGPLVLIITLAALTAYEYMAPQPSVEYWNTILDIWHDFFGAAFSVIAYNYLVPVEYH